MSDPYVGEIRMFAGTFAPEGWADCDGQILRISGNEMLFDLIGTTFGGDGVSTFALPDLQGRLPLGAGTDPRGGSTFERGARGGVNEVALTLDELPAHAHPLVATRGFGRSSSPENGVLASGDVKVFDWASPTAKLDARTVDPVGATRPHDNEMPYLVVRFVIALTGLYPVPA